MSDIAVHKILQYIEVHCSSKKNNIDKSSAQMKTIVSNPSTKFKSTKFKYYFHFWISTRMWKGASKEDYEDVLLLISFKHKQARERVKLTMRC